MEGPYNQEPMVRHRRTAKYLDEVLSNIARLPAAQAFLAVLGVAILLAPSKTMSPMLASTLLLCIILIGTTRGALARSHGEPGAPSDPKSDDGAARPKRPHQPHNDRAKGARTSRKKTRVP
jgi:hypothetical protein